MSLKESTAMRNATLVARKSLLDGGKILIFGGSMPTTADAAIGSATLLVTITKDSDGQTGLTFDTAPVNGVLNKNPNETWGGVIATSGNATGYRHVAANDDGMSTSTEPRIQGTVGTQGADLNLTAGTALVAGQPCPVNTYAISQPAGG